MWITIFNANESKVPKKREGQMLWSVVLFADDIIWSSAHAFLSCQRHVFVFSDERFKVNMYKAYVKYWKTEVSPEQLEKDYQNYIRIKKKKNKSKLDLKAIAKSQVYFKTVEKVMMNFIGNNEKDLGIKELAPCMNIYRTPGRKEIEVIALAAFVPHGPNLKREDTDVNLIVDITSKGFEIPLLSCEIESLLSFKEFGAKLKKDFFAKNKTNAIRKKFLEFVSPESLTSKQVEIIRNELNEKFREVTNSVGEFNKDLIEKKLTTDNLKEINARYTEKLIPCISEFQKAIENNIYMVQLKNKEDKPKIYRLYLVLTTVRNIVGLYEKLNIINQGCAVYVRDELQQKGVLDALKFFLYLKVED